MSDEEVLEIGVVAERVGIAVSAVRFYEDKGLITAVRSPGGRRRFPRHVLRRLSFILIAQKLGFSLKDINHYLEKLPRGRPPSKGDWTWISRQFRADLNTRINTLTRLRDRLDGCIGCGCLSLKACQLYNPDDEVAANGPGPFWLEHDPKI